MVPTTGRALCEMNPLFDKLSFDYAITVNGAVIWDLKKKQIIYRVLPDQDKILDLTQKAVSMEDIYTEVYSEEIYTSRYCYDNMERLGVTEDLLQHFKSIRTVVPDLFVEMMQKRQVEKLGVMFRSRQVMAIRKWVFNC